MWSDALPSLCVTRRGTRGTSKEAKKKKEGERPGHGWRRWGEFCVEVGEACQQSTILDEEQRASQRTHGSAPDPLRSVQESLRERRDSLRRRRRFWCPILPPFLAGPGRINLGNSAGYTLLFFFFFPVFFPPSLSSLSPGMQGLSSRAHAFSVEALVGKPSKRMKVSERHESSAAADAAGGIHSGENARKAGDATKFHAKWREEVRFLFFF